MLALFGVAAATGCSATVAAGDPPAVAASSFYAALSDHDAAAACTLLADQTRRSLEESADKPCEQALQDEQLPQARVRRVQVYGQTAFAELDHDTAFLGRFPQGWRVLAAGCQPRPRRPYDCLIEAS